MFPVWKRAMAMAAEPAQSLAGKRPVKGEAGLVQVLRIVVMGIPPFQQTVGLE